MAHCFFLLVYIGRQQNNLETVRHHSSWDNRASLPLKKNKTNYRIDCIIVSVDPWLELSIEGFRVQSLCEAFGVENYL